MASTPVAPPARQIAAHDSKEFTLPDLGKPLWKRRAVLELLTASPAVITAAVGALRTIDPALNWKTQPAALWFLLGAVGVYMASSCVRALVAHAQDTKDDDIPRDLAGCLSVMHHCLLRLKGRDPDDGLLRLVIHRYDSKTTMAKQLTLYVGGRGGKAGRTFSAKSGIIGRVIRTGKPQVVERTQAGWEDWLGTLMSDLGYSEKEALGLTRDRFSHMAVPILSGPDNEVAGVLYLDSSEHEFFSGPFKEEVLAACISLVGYLKTRYP